MYGDLYASDKIRLTCWVALSSSYRCLVGVAPIIAGLEENEMNVTHGKGVSTVLTTQPDTALFFACIKERNKSQWPCRKHFTAADADKEAAQLGDLPVTDNVLFGELWAKRSRGYLCSLEEGILKHWHFGRIALLGDSAHKVWSILRSRSKLELNTIC